MAFEPWCSKRSRSAIRRIVPRCVFVLPPEYGCLTTVNFSVPTVKVLIFFVMALLMAGAGSVAVSREQPAQSRTASSISISANSEQKPWGMAGNPKAVSRTITLLITEQIRLLPESIDVVQGETLKIVLTNNGALKHEFVIGTSQELEEHAALMVQSPDKGHAAPHIAQIAPGKTTELVWTFNRPGVFAFACPFAGHYQSAVVGRIVVTAPR